MSFSSTTQDSNGAAGKAASLASDLTHKAGEQLHNVAVQVEGAARSAAETGREVGDQVQVVAENMRGAIAKSVEDQPMTTLAMAAVLGFVLGAVWKS
jgi:ElaB/YqjD/DUF883 family membrane-anchored ribosome-binding protein